jgi:hypothetical protein
MKYNEFLFVTGFVQQLQVRTAAIFVFEPLDACCS